MDDTHTEASMEDNTWSDGKEDNDDLTMFNNLLENFEQSNNITAAEVHAALPSSLNSTVSVALLSVPQPQPLNRLPPNNFHIALCRRLHLPIHQKQ
eukprot:7625094-Ditylum_brightwellii.AAC.1